MRNNLALARVDCAVCGVEYTGMDGDKGVVVFCLKRVTSVAVYDLVCCGIGDGNMVGSNADDGT